MPGFSWKRFLAKTIILFVLYFIFLVLIHVLNVVPFLDEALTGEIEISDIKGIIVLFLLRTSFYFGIPVLFTIIFVLVVDRNLRSFLRSLIESVNIVYFFLMIIRAFFFFSGLDKAFGFSILDGIDLGVFLLVAVLNFFCYKKPYFLFIQPKESNNEKE